MEGGRGRFLAAGIDSCVAITRRFNLGERGLGFSLGRKWAGFDEEQRFRFHHVAADCLGHPIGPFLGRKRASLNEISARFFGLCLGFLFGGGFCFLSRFGGRLCFFRRFSFGCWRWRLLRRLGLGRRRRSHMFCHWLRRRSGRRSGGRIERAVEFGGISSLPFVTNWAGSGRARPGLHHGSGGQSRGFGRRRREIGGYDIPLTKRENRAPGQRGKYTIGRLVSPSDEVLDLSREQQEAALQATIRAWDLKKPPKKDQPSTPSGPFIRRQRDPGRGLLLIYPIDAGGGTPPLIGFAVSFPWDDNAREIEYAENSVKQLEDLFD